MTVEVELPEGVFTVAAVDGWSGPDPDMVGILNYECGPIVRRAITDSAVDAAKRGGGDVRGKVLTDLSRREAKSAPPDDEPPADEPEGE